MHPYESELVKHGEETDSEEDVLLDDALRSEMRENTIPLLLRDDHLARRRLWLATRRQLPDQ